MCSVKLPPFEGYEGTGLVVIYYHLLLKNIPKFASWYFWFIEKGNEHP